MPRTRHSGHGMTTYGNSFSIAFLEPIECRVIRNFTKVYNYCRRPSRPARPCDSGCRCFFALWNNGCLLCVNDWYRFRRKLCSPSRANVTFLVYGWIIFERDKKYHRQLINHKGNRKSGFYPYSICILWLFVWDSSSHSIFHLFGDITFTGEGLHIHVLGTHGHWAVRVL